jgi:hypothetical protein
VILHGSIRILNKISRGLFLLILFIGLSTLLMSTHPFKKVRQTRPGELNVSNDLFSEGGSIRVTYYLESENAPLNDIHSWKLLLEDKNGAIIENAEIVVSPDMPEHLHGMLTTAEVYELDEPGMYRVDGMKFHMPGWWEVTIDVTTPKTRDLVRFQLIIGENIQNHEHHQHH